MIESINNLYLKLTPNQKEIIQPLLHISNNVNVEVNENVYTISSSDKAFQGCPFEIIFHLPLEKISFYLDKDIIVLNYEDYSTGKKFKKWISKYIYLFLHSNIIIKEFSYRGKIKKRELYIEEFKGNKEFEFPIIAYNGFNWFWQKKRFKISEEKYNPWVIQ